MSFEFGVVDNVAIDVSKSYVDALSASTTSIQKFRFEHVVE
jgi:hypothetical protein